MILILTEHWDVLAEKVEAELRQRNQAVTRLLTEQIPQSVQLSLRFPPGRADLCLTIDTKIVDLDDVTTVWYRRPALPEPAAHLKGFERQFAFKESWHVLRSLYYLLRDRCRWVNQFERSIAAEYKPFQLQCAREVGFDVPSTVVTNDPATAQAFYDTHGGRVIYKSFSGPARESRPGRMEAVFTSVVDPSRFRRHLEDIRLAPCLFQEHINKEAEYRVTVMGRDLFVDRIRAGGAGRASVDWRRAFGQDALHEASSLPADVERLVLALMDRLGLVFACLDLAVTPEGRWVFFEVNPNGQWGWVEEVTGLPLMARFTQLLCEDRPLKSETDTAQVSGSINSPAGR